MGKVDIPTWIVGALASQPVTAIANLIALLSAREAIRVALRRWNLSPGERQLLEASERDPAPLPELEEEHEPREELPFEVMSATGIQEVVTRVRARFPELVHALNTVEPIVDVEVGHVRVRSRRPDIDIVVREGDAVTSVSIREPRR